MTLKDFFKKNDASAEKFKKIQNDRFTASQALEDNQALTRNLGIKIDGWKTDLKDLIEEQTRSERDKKEALSAFVSGRISQSEIDSARSKAEAARRAYEETLELIEAAERSKAQAERSVSSLQSVKVQADRAFWLVVLEDLKSQLDDVAKELFIAAYAAHGQAYPGSTPGFGSFFKITTSRGVSFDLHTPQGMATLDIESRAKVKLLEDIYGL